MHKGSCLCGRVRYEVTGDIGDFGYCHCTSCRKASGTAHAANAPVQRSDFLLESGAEEIRFTKTPRAHTWVSDKAPWEPIEDNVPQFPEWAPKSVLVQRGARQP